MCLHVKFLSSRCLSVQTVAKYLLDEFISLSAFMMPKIAGIGLIK